VVLSYYLLFLLENHVCLSRSVQVIGVAWWAAMKIVVGVGDLLQRIEDDQAQVRYSVAERSGVVIFAFKNKIVRNYPTFFMSILRSLR
jgi:hypothetical protein